MFIVVLVVWLEFEYYWIAVVDSKLIFKDLMVIELQAWCWEHNNNITFLCNQINAATQATC